MRNKHSTAWRVMYSCFLSCLSCGWESVLLLCLIFMINDPAFAQPVPSQVVSLDVQVINADYVCVGKIIKVRDQPIPNMTKMTGLTLEVEECLKLPVEETHDSQEKQRELLIDSPAAKYKDWMKRSSPLLVIFNKSSPQEPTVIELAPEKAEVITADFRLLRDPKQIVAAAKNAIERTPKNVKRLHTHRMTLPVDIKQGTRWENGAGIIIEVPVDGRLEKRAIKLLADKDPSTRFMAAQTLRYFKSGENAKLLANLLEDPATSSRADDAGTSFTHYYIREEVYQTLQQWGIKVDPPVLSYETNKMKN